MFLSLVLAQSLGIGVPGATPTPLPEIIHTLSSPACSTMRKMILPVGYVTKRNDAAFRDMSHSMQKFLSGIDPSDVPTAMELQDAENNLPTDNGAKASEGMGPGDEDDQLLYGPGQVLQANAIENVAEQIYLNIGTENSYMKQSWKDYPQGSDPKVDALRQRAQNLIDLQRALADRYEQFAGTYLSNQGMAALQQSQNRSQFKLNLRALLLGEAPTAASDEPDGTNDGYDDVSQLARIGKVAEIVRELRQQEAAFAPEVISTYNECNGTNIVIKKP